MIRHPLQLVRGACLVVAALLACCEMAPGVHAQGVAFPTPPQMLQGQSVGMTSGPRGPVPYMTTNGMVVSMPVSRATGLTFSRQSGFQLSVDFSWPGQYGYRPIKFTLLSQKPVPADQKITIEFTIGDWMAPRGKAMSARKSFIFPAGATTATETISVPRLQDWQIATWRVEVDGDSDDYLAVDEMHVGAFNSGMQSSISAIGVDLTGEQISNVDSVLQATANTSGLSVRTLAPADLPTNWLDYSSLDMVLISAQKLEQLATSHPQRLEALLRWVRTGGNLWVVRAGGDWERLPAIERAIGWTAEKVADESPLSDDEATSRGWRFAPVGERSTEPSQGALVLSKFDTGESNSQWADEIAKTTESSEDPTSAKWFAVRGHGLGAVAAFRHDIPAKGNTNGDRFYSVLSQSLLGPRLTWANRHGNQPDMINDEFNNLLIPGVGMAPVGQFQFLITLFALAIGPLNYWLLKRSNKLPLLLATVPVAAAVTTALLFAYGMAVDGFEVRSRTRSLTLLDQTTGEAAAWGRTSYYAGIAPRHGLEAPLDQAMYPIMPSWAATRYGRSSNAPREIVWDDAQRLTRGWLASRTPTQYHAMTSRPTTRRLELRPSGQGLRIVNRLGVDVTHVGVEDHDGKFYWCENLADGAAKIVPPTEQDTLTTGIRQQFTANIPESPGGDDFRYRQGFGQQWSQSLMEGRLEAINDPAIVSWGPGKYIAFTNQALELELGLEDVAEEKSFHVIEGSW